MGTTKCSESSKSWQARFGEDNIRNLRESLESLVGEATAEHSPLFRGLDPHPGGWRRRSPSRIVFRTTPWCCTAEGIRMAAEGPMQSRSTVQRFIFSI